MTSAVVGNMIVDLWECVREHIPEKKREDVAAAMIEVLLDHNFVEDVKDLEDAKGTDIDLDDAIDLVVEEHGEPIVEEDLEAYDE